MIPKTKVGIIGYGAAIPRLRLKTSDISEAHHKSGHERGLGIREKAVAAPDQDTVTLAVDAARQALKRSSKTKIGAIYVGSESHPYAVKPSAAIVGEALNIDHGYTAADFEFACKAGTASIQTVSGMVASGMIESGLSIGADVAQSKAGDPLEYASAAGAGAFVIGSDDGESPLLAELVATVSRTYDVPDFWRREHQRVPSHGGRFTGEPAYFRLISETFSDLLASAKIQISDVDHVVFHMPNAKFCKTIAGRLGVTDHQLEAGLTVTDIGNAYSACSLIGFAKILDQAKPNQTIILCSFGSGAGSDGFVWRTTEALRDVQENTNCGPTVQQLIDDKDYVSYVDYCGFRGKIL